MSNSIPPVNPDGQSLDYRPQQANAHVAGSAAQFEQQVLTPASMPKVKQSRDRAQYVRQQQPKSWVVWWLILGPVTLWIPAVYYSFSPNYFWKL